MTGPRHTEQNTQPLPVDEVALAVQGVNTRAERSRFWISPGARLGLVGLMLVCVAIFVFTGLPGIQAKQQNDREREARAAQARAGAALLHRFDCTYGVAVIETLKAAAVQQRVAAHIALEARHAALNRGDRRAANRSLMARRNYTKAGATYTRLVKQLTPLGRNYQGIPIPPCPRP